MSGSSSIKIEGLTLTRGNTKMGRVLNISLPPPLTCDLSLPCYRKGCYAMRSAYKMYSEVRRAWDGNHAVWRASRSLYEHAVVTAIAKAKPKLFRWHVGGDIPGFAEEADAYIGVVCRIAKAFPALRFWLTTKKHEAVDRAYNRSAIRACPNLSVVLSMWPGLQCRAVLQKRWPTAWVDDPKNPDLRIPADARRCCGHCESCAACWGMKAGESVVFEKH